MKEKELVVPKSHSITGQFTDILTPMHGPTACGSRPRSNLSLAMVKNYTVSSSVEGQV